VLGTDFWCSIAGTSDQVSFCGYYCGGISKVDMLFLLKTLSPVLAISWNEAKALKRNNQRCVSCPTMKCYGGCAPIIVLSVDTPSPTTLRIPYVVAWSGSQPLLTLPSLSG
jgi:hypothetical protein